MSTILVSIGYPRKTAKKKAEGIDLENEVLICHNLGNILLDSCGGVGSNIFSFLAISGGMEESYSSVNYCHRLMTIHVVKWCYL